MNKVLMRRIFQLGIAVAFGYFGILAILNPEIEGAKWIGVNMKTTIEYVMIVEIFMLLLGAAQVVVSISLLVNKFLDYTLPLAALLLVGIIFSLGWGELAIRDFAILTGVLYLYSVVHEQNIDDSR